MDESPLHIELNAGDPPRGSAPVESQRPPAPRPAIAHVLVYTACVAVAMAVGGTADDFRVIAGEEPATIVETGVGATLHFAFAMLAGVYLASVLVMLGRWYKRMRFPDAPGEWILVASGCSAWVSIVFEVAVRTLELEFFDLDIKIIFLWQGVVMLALAVPLAIGSWWLRRELRWAICLGAWATVSGLQAIVMLTSAAMRLLNADETIAFSMSAGLLAMVAVACAAISFLVSVVIDWLRRTPRGWIHWLGIGTIFASIAMTAVQLGVFYFVYG